MTAAFYVVMTVQFVSALADHALLIVAIARLAELGGWAWLVPMLKLGFTLCYVVLAPAVGALADRWPKGRVMQAANLIKCLAGVLFLLGAHPLMVLTLAGLGAALYAPAKYGLVTELVPPHHLVRANGTIESATVSAVVLGVSLGGLLVSPGWNAMWTAVALPQVSAAAPSAYQGGMLSLIALYVGASVLNLAIKDPGVTYDRHVFHVGPLWRRFVADNRRLWRDPLGGLSLAVTTSLWSIGGVLQLIVLRWAGESLGLPLEKAAYLQGLSALGVIGGAVLASRVSLDQATRLLPLGVLLGLLIPVMNAVHEVGTAALLLVSVGALAGFFVVPMNALLQHRGHSLLTAGRSIAVQGFNENLGILLLVAFYALTAAQGISILVLTLGFSVWITGSMLSIALVHRRTLRPHPTRAASTDTDPS